MIEMDNDMDVGVPVEAVNEPPEVKAEKETRPGKKTAKNATAKPVSRTAGKPSSRAKAALDGADQTGMVPAVNDTRSEAVADKPVIRKKTGQKTGRQNEPECTEEPQGCGQERCGNVFRFVTSDDYRQNQWRG